jgi:hypothetical protein
LLDVRLVVGRLLEPLLSLGIAHDDEPPGLDVDTAWSQDGAFGNLADNLVRDRRAELSALKRRMLRNSVRITSGWFIDRA